jgi:uncharacterized protein
MDNNDYQKAVDFARANFDKIEQSLPDSIKEREEKLFGKMLSQKFNSLNKLKMLYSEIDIIYSHLGKMIVCDRGCSHCCYQDIAISELEVEYILKNTKAKRVRPEIVPNALNGPCPFLKNHKCSIYLFRPFLCRRHVSLANSPRWCEQDVCNKYEFPLFSSSEVDKSYAYLLVSSQKEKMYNNIRQVFREF